MATVASKGSAVAQVDVGEVKEEHSEGVVERKRLGRLVGVRGIQSTLRWN